VILQKSSPGLRGGLRGRTIYLATVHSETWMPSFWSSPWVRGAP
jgi:hypothetical protein